MKQKKLVFLSFLIGTISLFGIAGCGKKTADTFPKDYSIASVDVGGMTAKQAKKALKAAVKDYKIAVTLDDASFDLKADELGLAYNEDLNLKSVLKSANKGEAADSNEQVFNVKTEDELEDVIIGAYISAKNEAQSDTDADKESVNIHTVAPYKATINYDEQSGQFIGVDGVSGEANTYTKAADDIVSAVGKLDKKIKVESSKEDMDGEKASENDDVQSALKDANEYLNIKITCDFKPDSGKEKTQELDKTQIAEWLIVGSDGRSVDLDAETMATYCTELASKYDVSKTKSGKFKTAGGDVIDIQVAVAGQSVDANKLFESIYEAIEKKKDTTVNAVYVQAEDTETGDYITFGGNYCEVDLTNQMVYVYKDGKQVLSSQCVTGNVSKGYGTPAGVYSIFSIDKDRYLRGDGYKTWVNFFVPFNGGIGFHDALWRSSFGGNIYQYSGSHGCINMPYDAAKKLYENVSMGEKVVLYGGVTKVEGRDQSWSGNTEFTVDQGATAFNLGVSCLDNAQLTYSSDNESVASVDAYGNVTPGVAGTATITINAASTGAYKASSMTVVVTVNAPKQQITQTPAQITQVQPDQTPTLTIGSGNVTVTEGDNGFNVGASVNNGATLTYESSDSSVVSVDSNGNVSILRAGTATITVKATAKTGWKENSSSITVTVNPKQQDVPATEAGNDENTNGNNEN